MPGRVVSFWMRDELVDALDSAATEAGVPRNRWVTERLEEATSALGEPSGPSARSLDRA
jgi:hypothetical protein